MKKLLILILPLFLYSCNDNDMKEIHCHKFEKYPEISVQIISKGGQVDRHGKFPSTFCKSFLVRSVNDTTQFTEISTEWWTGRSGTHDWGVNSVLTDSLYYTKSVGDTLHCTCMSYERFWTDKK